MAEDTKTILIVDDDPDVRRSVATFIKFGGYNIIEADSPSQALSLLDKADGMVSDNNMLSPDSDDGLNLSKTARANGFKGPIIVISGKFTTMGEPAPEYGVDATFSKPVRPTVLNAMLSTLFKKKAKEAGNKIDPEVEPRTPQALKVARQEQPETHVDRSEGDGTPPKPAF